MTDQNRHLYNWLAEQDGTCPVCGEKIEDKESKIEWHKFELCVVREFVDRPATPKKFKDSPYPDLETTEKMIENRGGVEMNRRWRL